MDHYTCKAEPLWKCKRCGYKFLVTSGTVFAGRELPLRDILVAIAIVKSGAENLSALQLSFSPTESAYRSKVWKIALSSVARDFLIYYYWIHSLRYNCLYNWVVGL